MNNNTIDLNIKYKMDTIQYDDCSICLETMKIPFKLKQCTHSFHSVCVMKSMEYYLANYGTEWQTVPCPICKKRISYHIILENFIETAELKDIQQIINNNNIKTKCHMDRSLLYVAASAGRMETLIYLINNGLPVDTPNDFGLTPVYSSAVNGHTDMVKYLVENFNVNINCKSFFGETPLSMAIKNNHFDTVKYLESINAKHGIPINQDWFENIETTKHIAKLLISTI